MRALPAVFLFTMLLIVPGCDGDDPDPAPAPAPQDTGSVESDAGASVDDATPADTGGAVETVTFEAVVEALTMSCSGCHGAGGCSYPASCFLDDEADLIADSLAPGCPDGSNIAECSLARMENETMPPKGTKPPPTAEQIQVLQDWIDAN